MPTSEEYPYRLIGNVWPERVGRRCRIVPPPSTERKALYQQHRYPWWHLPHGSVVIKIEDDPLADWPGFHDDWSCVVRRENLERAGPQPNLSLRWAHSLRSRLADLPEQQASD